MSRALILCDHASHSDASKNAEFHETHRINQYAPDQNLRVEVLNISHRLLKNLRPITRDLLDIAAFVYHADNSVRRGTNKDLFNEKWVREFTFVVPVRKLDMWQCDSVRAKLIDTLEYLTEDKFNFEFVEREARPEQLIFKEFHEDLPYAPQANCVTLFSGGMDSLAGAVYLHSIGRKPLLVSHRSHPVLATRQRDLASKLRQRSSWGFPHLDIWINRMGEKAVENTQRSRSFLFLALGSLVAYEQELNELTVCENGITTLNLPRLGQTTGTLATRSTHPRFIELFRQLVSEVFEIDFRIKSPFLWKTRSEVIVILKQQGFADLLPLSASCNQSRRPKIYPHCGTCSQCVDRRFSVIYTGPDSLEDELIGYEKDIFTDELENGEERMQAVSVVQFALDIQKQDALSFFEKYVQVYDVADILPGNPERNLRAIYDLHRRFSNETLEALGKEHNKNLERLWNRKLPDTCLLMIASSKSSPRPNPIISERAKELIQELRDCPVGASKPFEDLCEEALTFLFCEDSPPECTLDEPIPQSETDQGYERRDLIFRNRATKGFWAEVRDKYDAEGIIVDSKNYNDEIDGNTVHDFAKYLKKHGLGRFGLLIAREVSSQTQSRASREDRVQSAIKEQKDQWREAPHRMIIILGEDDLVQMLEMKVNGLDPTDLLSDRIFTLKSRI